MTPPYQLTLAGVDLNPTVPPGAVTASGGGREVRESVSVTGRIIRTLGHLHAHRVRIASPGPEWALRADQIAHLDALKRAGTPFTVTLGAGYTISGTFADVTLDGDAFFTPKFARDYVAYDLTLYIPQETP